MTVAAEPRFDDRYYATVEALIGRPLRYAERAIDVLALNAALKQAKDEIAAAIEVEKARAIRAALRGNGTVRLGLTAAMIRPLQDLFDVGRREAALELAAAGYKARRYDEAARRPHIIDVAELLKRKLRGVTVRTQTEYASLTLDGELGYDAVLKALLRVPGARDAASRVVSKALTTGLSATFTDSADIVSRWEYTAVLDGGTCDECEPLDGTQYDTIDALFEVLPDFGPNPLCLGEDRCRCRAVPA